jgi:hypothetical protein
VSAAQAQTITGERLVSKREAPLGPTCVFKFKGRLQIVTIVVERASIQKLAGPMKSRVHVSVAGLPGYCGSLGSPILFVALRSGGVLSVTAPCRIAEGFAAAALAAH